ncbi:uncharacterized protein DDB_G0284459 isoform X2 [Fundulus heteroclitus]|uniref:uncharacterized protein DDB_G0284459 isoform X2 n=1 Tax=Fundulus heteroclitus TaxID=8078 RepID=UPI00165AB341|nr:uncharacterized protein DDB_G0284459 isoform X2 [Fundulus heteroclitus]
MSSEVCPFCGKTYKRLKSHLPHCKAAGSSKTPPTTQDVAATQKASSHPAAALSKATSEGKKTKPMSSLATDVTPERSEKASVPSLKPAPTADGSLSSSSPASVVSSSKKKKTQSLADQIRTTSLSTSPSSPLSSTLSKPKKKSLRALIEAAKSGHVAKEAPDGTGSSSKDSGGRRTRDQTETKEVADSLKGASVISVPAHAKANREPKTKETKDVLSTTNYASDVLDSDVNKTNPSPVRVRENFWVDGELETEEGAGNGLFLKPGGDRQMKVTLQDVKATLGRRQSGRPSVLSRIAAADELSSGISLDADLSLCTLAAESQKHGVNHWATSAPQSDKQLSTKTRPRGLQLFQKQSKALEAAAERAKVKRGTSSLSTNESLKADPKGGLLSVSAPLNQSSCLVLQPPPPPPPPPPAAAPSSPGTVEDSRLDVGKKNVAEKPQEGLLTQRKLGQVTLKELPDWLASRTPSRPTDVIEMVRRGWLWYYRKYFHVKKGGVGGASMLLAGYCVLGYIWSYPRIKLSRWRKYH